MSEPAYMVIGLGIVAVVALGVVAMFFGRALHLKGGDLEVRVSEPKPVPPAPPPVTKPPQVKKGKMKGPRRR